MKYLLMMHAPGRGPYQITTWPPDAIRNHIQFMHDFAGRLVANGELAGAEGLGSPADAKLVRAGPDGAPVTDGVFPETKEFLAGFWMVDVATPERAYAIAAEASTAPGPDGKPLYMGIEVRQVLGRAPDAECEST